MTKPTTIFLHIMNTQHQDPSLVSPAKKPTSAGVFLCSRGTGSHLEDNGVK